MEEETRGFSGAHFANLRKELGFTQRRLASAAGVSQALIAELETGKHPPSKLALEKLAAALSLAPEALLERRESP